jgi:hypothetical protein
MAEAGWMPLNAVPVVLKTPFRWIVHQELGDKKMFAIYSLLFSLRVQDFTSVKSAE